MTDTHEKCSCGSRQKSKCVKESTSINGARYGKMCLKAGVSIMDISTEKSVQISERGREKILDDLLR